MKSHEFWGKESDLQLLLFFYNFEEKCPGFRSFVKKIFCLPANWFLGEYRVFMVKWNLEKLYLRNENQAFIRRRVENFCLRRFFFLLALLAKFCEANLCP